jgi:ElaB/YqjD/DUF883 family membrane-anchored ribosome-binding protein
MFGASSGRRADVSSELATLRRDVANLAESVGLLLKDHPGSEIRGSVEKMRRSLESHVSDLGETGSRLAGEARDRVAGANARLETRIGESPLSSVLIAAGIGFVLGLISRGRR